MADTKEKILMTALRLFAQDGYEAVSVSRIAGELGMTKGALYKHYKNKRDIFETIFERICQLDRERFAKAGLSIHDFSGMPQSINTISLNEIKAYMVSQFYYWTDDEVACNFRRMLTLEQYRSIAMMELYQKVLTSGPVNFIENQFNEMIKKGTLSKGDSKQMAMELYAPFYLLLSISDAALDKKEKDIMKDFFVQHIDKFIEKYNIEK